jgi:predicted site-specific integrase-resolvase
MDAAPDGTPLLGYKDIAGIVGVREGTLRNYARRGYMPPPDVMLADRPRWRRTTIAEWEHRRKVGANTRTGPA